MSSSRLPLAPSRPALLATASGLMALIAAVVLSDGSPALRHAAAVAMGIMFGALVSAGPGTVRTREDRALLTLGLLGLLAAIALSFVRD